MTDRQFEDVIDMMPKYLRELEGCNGFTRDDFPPNFPNDGVYVFYHGDMPTYVGRAQKGRSQDLKKRIQQHGQPGGHHNTATFAFNLAKLAYLQEDPDSYSETRSELEKSAEFKPFFEVAKCLVAEMTIRVVEIRNPIEQTVFEVYAHMKLGTPFNDFRTH